LANVQVNVIDQTVGTGSIVKLQDAVGAQESLLAQTTPAAAQSYMGNPIAWTIPFSTTSGSNSWVGGYTQTDTSASIVPVNLAANPLSFYPIAPYSANGDITFHAANLSAGTAYHASISYSIQAPTVKITETDGDIQVGLVASCLCEAITAGPVTNQMLIPGQQWTAAWTSSSSAVHGNVGMTQLVYNTVYVQYAPAPGATPPSYLYTTYGSALDADLKYPQYSTSGEGPALESLPADTTAHWGSLDDPYIDLRSCLREVWPYYGFTDYFFFLPDPKGNYTGIPATIATTTWTYDAYSLFADGDWGNPVTYGPLVHTAPATTSQLPTWTSLAQDDIMSLATDCKPPAT
jgi:hypothetical protein